MENPLMTKRQEMTLSKMADLTGLHVNTLSNISKFDESRILNMRVGSVLLLKKKLGVNMLDFIPGSAGV